VGKSSGYGILRPPPARNTPGAITMKLKQEMEDGMLESVEEAPDR
jgi:hypothetical protein